MVHQRPTPCTTPTTRICSASGVTLRATRRPRDWRCRAHLPRLDVWPDRPRRRGHPTPRTQWKTAVRKFRSFAGGSANGPNRPICGRCRWCRNLPLVEGPHSARRSCRRVRRPRGRRQPLTGSPATAQALSVARRGGEPAEFALDEPGEGERRPVFVFGADDLHADRQAIRDRDRNDGRRQPAGRRGIGPDQ